MAFILLFGPGVAVARDTGVPQEDEPVREVDWAAVPDEADASVCAIASQGPDGGVVAEWVVEDDGRPTLRVHTTADRSDLSYRVDFTVSMGEGPVQWRTADYWPGDGVSFDTIPRLPAEAIPSDSNRVAQIRARLTATDDAGAHVFVASAGTLFVRVDSSGELFGAMSLTELSSHGGLNRDGSVSHGEPDVDAEGVPFVVTGVGRGEP
jgi:hypothetical protein